MHINYPSWLGDSPLRRNGDPQAAPDGFLDLFWKFPQPPSGELSQFEILRRDSQELQITRKILTVEETEHRKDIFHAKLGSVEENMKYFFKIRSYNKDYDKSSDWSTEMDFQIRSVLRLFNIY